MILSLSFCICILLGMSLNINFYPTLKQNQWLMLTEIYTWFLHLLYHEHLWLFYIVKFYFSFPWFVTKHSVTIKFFLFMILLILPHVLLYFFNKFLSLIKKHMVLISPTFFTCSLIFGSKTHNSVTSSLFL